MAAILKQFLDDIDQESDEISNKNILEEYNVLLNYTSLYPWLQPFRHAVARLVHLFVYHIYQTFMIASCFITAYLGSDDFIIAGSYINYGMISLTFEVILLQVTLQRKNMARVHRIIGQGVFDYNEDTPIAIEEIAIKTKYKSLIRWAKIIIPSTSLFGGCVLLLFGPLIDSIAGVEKKIHSDSGVNYDLPVPFWTPYDSNGPVTYWLTVVLIAISITSTIFVFISFNIVYFTVCLHIACHLEIIILYMKNIESRAKTLFQQKYNLSCENDFHVENLYKDKDFMKCLEVCFKENIQHHQVILRVYRASTIIFRNPIFTFFFMVGFMVALASYAAISLLAARSIAAAIFYIAFPKILFYFRKTEVTGQPGGVINFVDLAVVLMLNVALTCKVGQNITDLNSKFRIELYSASWYQYDKTVTNLLTIVQEFSYRDLVIEAPFSFAANMNTFASVLNTTYSYFSLILAWASKTNDIN